MSEQSRHARYSDRQLPRRKRTLPLYGEKDDTGKFYKCWNCGFTCNAERDSLNTGEMGVSGVNTISNLSLLLHMDGANLSNTFIDSSPNAKTVTANGNAKISTTYYKFGTGSCILDGTGDYLTISDSAGFDLSATDWTIDFWIYPSAVFSGSFQGIYFQRTDNANYFSITLVGDTGNQTARLSISIVKESETVVSLYTPVGSLAVTTWNHVEISDLVTTARYYTTSPSTTSTQHNYRVYVDGKLIMLSSDSDGPANYTGTIYIGCSAYGGSPSEYLNGYIDEFRVMKSVQHLDRTFTVPTEAYDPDTHYAPGHYKPDVSGGCSFCGCTNYR